MGFDLDAATDLGDYPRLQSLGAVSVSRYVAPDQQQYDWKRIKPAEGARINSAGIVLRLNFETAPQGAWAGLHGGDVAADAMLKAWDQMPYADSVGWFSDDTRSTLDQVLAFFDELTRRLHPDHVGYYGGEPVGLNLLDRGLVSRIWVANAAYFSGLTNWRALRDTIDPRCHLIQHLDKPLPGIDAASYDYNEILRDDYLGGTVPLTGTDIENAAKAIGDYLERPDGPLGWFVNVIKGDPHANAVANFLTDIHNAEGAELVKLDAILAALGKAISPAAQTDPAALAKELAPLLTAAERLTFVSVLQSAK